MRPEIREASPRDVPSLEVIRRQAIEADLEGAYDRTDVAELVATSEADLVDWIESDTCLALLVETEVTTVAFGVYDRSSRELRALYTAPDYQRHGCATALLDRFTARANESGADEVDVVAPQTAVPFFEGRGFERRATVERDGLSFVRLTRSLD